MMTTAEQYLVAALAIAVLVVIVLLALGRVDAAELDRATAERDEARREARELRRQEGPLRAELAALRRHARQEAVAAAALTPDANLQALRDLHTCRRIWAAPAHTDTPGADR